jgi:hypothetical protein
LSSPHAADGGTEIGLAVLWADADEQGLAFFAVRQHGAAGQGAPFWSSLQD